MNKVNGFTLIELVLVIAMLSILSLGFVGFIKMGSKTYQNVTTRSSLSSDASFVLERLNKELRNALPHSIRILDDGVGQCLEFIPITSVQVYATSSNSENTTTNKLKLIKLNSELELRPQDRVVLSSPSSNDGYDLNLNKTAEISKIEAKQNNTLVTLSEPIALTTDSSRQYLYVVAKPVSYCAANGRIVRVVSNEFHRRQKTHQDGDLMSENIDLSAGFPFAIDNSLLSMTKVQINLNYKENNHTIIFNSGVNIRHEP